MNIAYRKLARKYHPDKYNKDREFSEEEERIETFKYIANAYEELRLSRYLF